MSRLALLVAYDGTEFSGWQRQPGRRTVQGVLEAAVSDLAGRHLAVRAAGRTDAGVHAAAQVVSVDGLELAVAAVPPALGSRLPADVSVLEAIAVEDGFDARHDATSRRYVYLIWNAPAPHPLLVRHAAHVPEPLDADRMRRALRIVVGTHDFTSFARIRADQSPERTVLAADVTADGPLVRIEIEAVSFLHQMVRSIVGQALRVGTGRAAPGAMGEALMARDRAAAARVAPPQGLCLAGVHYDGLRFEHEVPWPWAATTRAAGTGSIGKVMV